MMQFVAKRIPTLWEFLLKSLVHLEQQLCPVTTGEWYKAKMAVLQLWHPL